MRIVSDDDVSNALTLLAETTAEAAAARAAVLRAEHQTRRIKASLVLASKAPSLGLREAEAMASDELQRAVEAEAGAIEADHHFRLIRSNAEALIEAWRTESSNIRTSERIR